jgi:hypothetical protein
MLEGWSVSTVSGLAVLGAVALSGDGAGGGGGGGKPDAFKGKVVWITGASSGIGEAMVRSPTCPYSHLTNKQTNKQTNKAKREGEGEGQRERKRERD